MSASLEQQRLALLTKIRLSRTAYKNILLGETENNSLSNDDGSHYGMSNFPKSMTFKWIDNHLLLTTTATGCLIYLATLALKSQGIKDTLAKQAHYFLSAKKSLNRIFRIGTTILNNPDHQHLVKFLGRVISNKLSR